MGNSLFMMAGDCHDGVPARYALVANDRLAVWDVINEKLLTFFCARIFPFFSNRATSSCRFA
jgi:hypothetical protein